jgi:hypothetical protein
VKFFRRPVPISAIWMKFLAILTVLKEIIFKSQNFGSILLDRWKCYTLYPDWFSRFCNSDSSFTFGRIKSIQIKYILNFIAFLPLIHHFLYYLFNKFGVVPFLLRSNFNVDVLLYLSIYMNYEIFLVLFKSFTVMPEFWLTRIPINYYNCD